MSILMKISIVLLVVLVLVACPVFITQATQLPSYKEAYERRGTELESVSQANRHLQLALKQAQQQGGAYAEAVRKVEAEKRSLQASLQAQIDDLTAEKLGMKGKLADLTAAYRALGQSMKMEIARGDRLAGELDGARKRINELMGQINQLNAALADKDVAISRLERTVQKFREDVARLEKENGELAKRLQQRGGPPAAAAVGAGPEAPVEPVVPPIRGTVTAVEDDVASINIGAANGIKKGMKLIVYRDGEGFVSYLQIELVDLNSAAGVIVDKRQGLQPRPNDKVRTR